MKRHADGPGLSAAVASFHRAADRYSALGNRASDSLTAEEWVLLLAEMGEALREVHEAGVSVSRYFELASARLRIGSLLKTRLGEIVTKSELAGVALASEWARRVRELGHQEGWVISSGPGDDLPSGTYRLEEIDIDLTRADAWQLRNSIRRRPGAGGQRCLDYLLAVYPNAASKEDLAYVSKIQSWPRRVRELSENGWKVVSSDDDPTLAPGTYRLDSQEQGPPRSRQAIARRHEILKRDGWRCRDCGASPKRSSGVRLQIHHIIHVAAGGGNDENNLVTLCVSCHAGRHALDEGQVDDELLNPAANPDVVRGGDV